ncbi:class I SAM-dependent methyltransferase [Mucilaginibacter calamicampi]|uniref:Class I SAM-dependent methyltransferase n=1 Tax=Mucilaginibacter calamicampi TaxID=1302352 RepID=A0ABW2YY58_9SPHI
MKETDEFAEEIFCLKYELNTLASVLLRNESERWLPGFLHERTEYSHVERYKLACKYTSQKNVLDVACGIGKGSSMMAQEGGAALVNGFDIQPEAVRYANWRNAAPNLTFSVVDAETMDIVEAYEMAVSFETIEHLHNYRSFLINVNKSIRAGGYLLISTPISAASVDSNPINPYHTREWGFTEFQKVLNEFFSIEKIFVQLYPPSQVPINTPRKGIIEDLIGKIKRKLGFAQILEQVKESANGFSKIEEYTGQYAEEELGVSRVGYQIVLARKN